MTRDTIAPSEDNEQIALFVWIGRNVGQQPELALAFHVPNGGHRDPHVGVHMKRMGVKRGVPDLLLPVKRGRWAGLAIELKRTVGGRVSQDQQWWLFHLREQGWRTVVCRGADEAIATITDYMEQ